MFAAGGRSTTTFKPELISKKKDELIPSKSVLELQAELLRLEAEKELILISQNRIDEEKVCPKIYPYFLT